MRRDLNFSKDQRFGMLVVEEEAEPTKNGGRRYHCRCDCGKATIAVASNMARGIWESCGCRRAAAARENGKKHTASTRMLTYQGETLSLGEWAARVGITKGALRHRLDAGWSEEQALSEPLLERRERP